MKQKIAKKSNVRLSKRLELMSKQAGSGGKEHIQENLINRLHNAKQVRLLMLEWILLVVVIISLALTQAFWYQQSYSTSAFVNGGVYTEATLGKVNSLNPLFATTSSEKVLSRLMFATISEIDYSGHVGLGLAKSIVPDETGKIWTVELKPNLKWSDGVAITPEDVVFTVELLQSTAINSTYTGSFAGVKVRTEGSKIIFELPSVYPDFNTALNVPVLPRHVLKDVAPANLLEHAFSSNPVTSGPFTFNAAQSINAADRIIYLSGNSAYFDGEPMLDSFAVRTFSSTDDIITAISTGEVTATAELSPLDDSKITGDIVYEKQTAIANGVFAFLNTTSSALKEVAVRQAIQSGVNFEELRDHLDGELPLEYPILSSQIRLNQYPEIPQYDLAKAKATILEHATARELRVATISTGYLPELARAMSKQLEELGFAVTVDVYDPGQEFLVNVIRPRNYDILIYEVELGADPDLFAYYHSSQASVSGLNLSNYHNAMADDAILAARSTMDEALRMAKYESFLRYWVEEVPAIGIYQANLTYYFNKNVRTFSEDDRLVFPTDRFSDVKYWAVNKAEKNRTP